MAEDFDLKAFLPYLLNRAGETAALEFQRYYKDRYGMLRTDWRVLFHLGLFGQMTARDISLRAGIHKTKVSRAVARLEARRWATRAIDEQDRRLEHLRLTAVGQRVYHDLHHQAQLCDARLTKGFSDQEVAALRSMLNRLANP